MSASSDKNKENEKRPSYRAQKREREEKIERLIKDALEKSESDSDDTKSHGNSSFDTKDTKDQSGKSTHSDDKDFDNKKSGSDFRSPKGEKKSLAQRKKDAMKTVRNARNLPSSVASKAREVKKKAAIAKEQAKKFRKMSKDDMNRMAKRQLALKKAAIKKQLAQKAANTKKKLRNKLRGKVKINAKYGKSPYMSCFFVLMLFIAIFNDVLLDLFLSGTIELISLIISLTGIGSTIGGIVIAVLEIAGSVLDVITGFILVGFSLITGGVTKSSMGKKVSRLFRAVGCVAIEQIPIVNLFFTWTVTIIIDWYIMRKDATKAEEMAQNT
ncbi:MAG: hypothetical protein KAI71_03295 [Candidatus Pacebacteria bacterium]|nr:hypothetical protein [Candidatus Paceibacterota bacterium]